MPRGTKSRNSDDLWRLARKSVHDRSKLPMFNFDMNLSFTSFDLIVLNKQPKTVTSCLGEIYAILMKGELHTVKPLAVFGIGEVEAAFRNLQSGDSMGKIATAMQPTDMVRMNI